MCPATHGVMGGTTGRVVRHTTYHAAGKAIGRVTGEAAKEVLRGTEDGMALWMMAGIALPTRYHTTVSTTLQTTGGGGGASLALAPNVLALKEIARKGGSDK